ncbi:diaminopropionate ammonia-lyase [Lactobacillus mulieris]|uniref:diaminopropionate ammonia-lyase n=2 Tax=Lactobacillus mulieris TaxID=2508708 RepID=UPI001ADE7205|nr:diaminopropionate ammonia-lyase [Lactobacillus mulieris]MDK6803930.1 diaminopropionate ammonia-lyase [Lactobacillus mulieris]MDK8383088.1 diaminopropionate ammonia-lyase [Lactobacillus mulieris]MDT9621268.1 diaminopropionate ammonia-lyase [Lactobacillus mulieris]
MTLQLIKTPFEYKVREGKIINPDVIDFYKSVPNYRTTPLYSLKNLAKKYHVAQINVKDESKRFGLEAFKGTGGLYAMAQVIAKKAGLDTKKLTYQQLQTPEIKKIAASITFYTATDGNHGRGIAWAAKQLSTHAVVNMPKGSQEIRAQHIRDLGAPCVITDLNYDDVVKYTSEQAKKDSNGILIQDMAWGDYMEIPTDISDGYSIVADEFLKQMNQTPTHIFLQAGVGQFSSGMINALIDQIPKEKLPIITIVEPETVACYYLSAKIADGKAHTVPGSPKTIMAGLNCQTPSAISWPIIKDSAKFYATLSDDVAAKGMRQLANPIGDDSKIISGESGAAAFAFVNEILSNPNYQGIRNELKLDENARIIVVNTEGATDPINYQKIMKES